MRYLCDQVKRAANLKKHGYDLDDAPVVVESPAAITLEDKRFDYGEQRFITLGMLHDVVVVIVTAETDEEIRVISMRKAERNEQEIYFNNIR
ncbi:MAG: BrnT family toxin [Propionivibrio sp.]|nr:BrnT family toxin [Propionivibrio sp.]